MPRLALLSDVHANLPALEAVAEDISRQSPDAVYVLGDMINGCAWPAETLDRLLSLGWPMLIGNHDDAVLQLDSSRMESRYGDRRFYATLWWTRAHLSARHLALIESLPETLSLEFENVPPVRLLHGLPGSFFVGFRPDSPKEWALRYLAPVEEATVAGGHTHFPMVRTIGRWQVVNSGSVGAPYDGDGRASYLLMDGFPGGWRVEVRRVEFDRKRVDAGYLSSGLAEEGGVLGVMFNRTVLTGLPYVSDFTWWARQQPPEIAGHHRGLLDLYDSQFGPGHWAFPLPG